jgi:hypothetical protein
MTDRCDCRSHLGRYAAAVFTALCLPNLTVAAWLGYKNETTAVVVIQSGVVVNNQLRWGKPHSLFPGEVAWDAVTAPGARVVGVYDPKQNNRLVYQESILVGNADIFLSLRMVTPPILPGRPPQPPQPRFIAITGQIVPPGTGPGKPDAPPRPPNTPIAPPRPPNTPIAPPQKPPAPPPKSPPKSK